MARCGGDIGARQLPNSLAGRGGGRRNRWGACRTSSGRYDSGPL